MRYASPSLALFSALCVASAQPTRRTAPVAAVPCEVRSAGSVDSLWRQVRASGFTFCVPASWQPSGQARDSVDASSWKGGGGSVTWGIGRPRSMIGPDVVFTVTMPVITVPRGGTSTTGTNEPVPLPPDRSSRQCSQPTNTPSSSSGVTVMVTQIQCQGIWTTTAWSTAPAMYIQAEAHTAKVAALEVSMMSTIQFTFELEPMPAPVTAGPAPSRFTRGSVDVVILPDTTQGLEMWFELVLRRPHSAMMTCARFQPDDVVVWATSMRPLLDSVPARGTDTMLWTRPPVLQGMDGGFFALRRKRIGVEWDGRAYLNYARPDSNQVVPLEIASDLQSARRFLDSLNTAATRSRYRTRGEHDPAWIDEVDERPQDLVNGVAEFPEDLRKHGASGKVWLQFIVDTNGVVEPPSIRVALSDDPRYADAALKVFKGSKFRPGKIGGRAVQTELCMPMSFEFP